MSGDFLARLKAGELIPLRGQPKTPEFALACFEIAEAAAQEWIHGES